MADGDRSYALSNSMGTDRGSLDRKEVHELEFVKLQAGDSRTSVFAVVNSCVFSPL